jgi:S1-C subfamily serine protease
VLDALENGPAAHAGVQRGDVVLAFDGAPITGVDELHRALTVERAGVPAALTLLRRTELVKQSVTPQES